MCECVWWSHTVCLDTATPTVPLPTPEPSSDPEETYLTHILHILDVPSTEHFWQEVRCKSIEQLALELGDQWQLDFL